jgi:RimJ/RimL family protein N-acetyltransferase
LTFEIISFNPKNSSNELWEKYHNFDESIFQERNPDDPLPDRELEKSFMKEPSPLYNIYRWLVLTSDKNQEVIGKANLWFQNEKSPDFKNVSKKAQFYISIRKEYRRKKIASELLKIVSKEAREQGKTILRAEITENEEAIAFCKKYNGRIVAQRAQNRLYLKDVKWNLMDDWRENAKRKAMGVTLELFEKVPETDLIEYCKLYTETMNQAPSEDLVGEMIITPKSRRIDEQTYAEKGCEWVTIISRESTGVISGLTEVFYHPSNSHWAEQELTGVKNEFRGRGLGKWLKAEMVFYIKERFPEVEFIQTGNNDANEAMLSINNRMGFKRYKSEVFFEFNIDELIKIKI